MTLREPPAWTWLLLPIACHLGFSWIGFNPTDEGWLQAIARRMLAGEVPHRDFISVRPVLSALLQVPLVAVGGDHLLWLARLWGWLEVGGIAWLWSGLLLDRPVAPWARPLAFAVVFFPCAHTFPVMAWHTLDGLLLCSLATHLSRRGTPAAWAAAFVCAGLAVLCRQNFVFFVPLLALGLPEWRRWPWVLWACVPGAVYLSVMAGLGAGSEFLRQLLSSQGLLYRTAIGKYTDTPVFLVAGVVALGLGWGLARGRNRFGPLTAAGLFTALGLFFAGSLLRSPEHGIAASFVLFASTLGLLAATLIARPMPRGAMVLISTAAGLAWTAAISLGYNNPALASGVLLLANGRLLAWLTGFPWSHRPLGHGFWLVLAAALGGAVWHARQSFPYQDRPAAELAWDAGTALRGAAGLRTNPLTFAALQDLRELTDRFEAEGRSYAILSDYSAHWILSRQRNPLPCEWPQATELGSDPRLAGRFIRELCRLSPHGTIIVQKHLISAVPMGLVRVQVASHYYGVQEWLRRNGRRTGETDYFELYAPPSSANAPRED